MVKQSGVTGPVSVAITRGGAALQLEASRKTGGVVARWRGFGRASAVVAVGLSAAFAAPREAHALPVFTDISAYALNQTTPVAGSTTTTATSQPCSDTNDPGCNTNSMFLIDIDQDGDLDLLEANGGGVFTTGLAEEGVVYGNDGKGSFLNLTGLTTGSSLGNPHAQARTVIAADIDGDGDIDIYQPSGYGTEPDKLFVQTATGIWEDRAATNLPKLLSSRAASAKFGDVDRDGDLDLLVADWGTGQVTDTGRLILYRNDGTGIFTLAETEHDVAFVTPTDLLPPTIPPSSTTGIFGFRPTDVDFADIDGDFDLDILINNRQGYSRIFINDGTGKFSDGTAFTPTFAADGVTVASATSNYPPKVGPYANNQEVCDLDEDGDLDIILDNAGPKATGAANGGGNNATQVLLNDGTGKFNDNTKTMIVSEPTADDGIVRCADTNADGHYDLVVGSRTNVIEKLLLNDGTGKFSYVSDAFPTVGADVTLAMAVGDINADGKMDIITGQGEGALTSRLNHVYIGKGNPDTTPPVIRKLQTPVPVVGAPTVFYMAVRDSATNEAGQMVSSVQVQYAAKVGTKTTTKTATAVWVGGDLFRVSIPAQVDGTVLTLTPSVTDRLKVPATGGAPVGLVTTAPAMVFQIGTVTNTGGTGGAGGTGGTAGTSGGTGGSGGSAVVPPVEAGAGGEAGIADEAGAAGEGGVAGVGPVEAGGKGGSSGSPGTGISDAGAPDSGGSAGTTSTNNHDDGGCSVAAVPVSKGRAVLLGFGLAIFGLVRRRRNEK